MLRRFGFSKPVSWTFDVVVPILFAIGLIQFVLWFDYRKPVHVGLRVFDSLVVPHGGKLEYTNYFTRKRFCDTTVRRWFVGSDGVMQEIDPLPSSMPTEGLHMLQASEASISVPATLPPGPTKSCFQSKWRCGGPIQAIWPIEGPETCLGFVLLPPPGEKPDVRPYVRASFAVEHWGE